MYKQASIGWLWHQLWYIHPALISIFFCRLQPTRISSLKLIGLKCRSQICVFVHVYNVRWFFIHATFHHLFLSHQYNEVKIFFISLASSCSLLLFHWTASTMLYGVNPFWQLCNFLLLTSAYVLFTDWAKETLWTVWEILLRCIRATYWGHIGKEKFVNPLEFSAFLHKCDRKCDQIFI